MLIDLGFHGLQTRCIIGFYENERRHAQLIESDLAITIDFQDDSDDLDKTINYTELTTLFAEHAATQKCVLLESLAVGFKERLMDTWPHIRSGVLEIRKPAAIPEADSAFVRLSW